MTLMKSRGKSMPCVSEQWSLADFRVLHGGRATGE